MAFLGFGKKNKEITKAPKQARAVEKAPVQNAEILATEGFSTVLVGMRVTEKASLLSEKDNVYTFNVSSDATKNSVSDAVKMLYKVVPEKVRIVRIPAKKVFVRGKRGVRSGGHKAYVYVKKGEKIDIS